MPNALVSELFLIFDLFIFMKHVMLSYQDCQDSSFLPGIIPTAKVRHEFGKNCAIDKYFGTHVKNSTIVQWKSRNYLIKSYFLWMWPNLFNNFEMSISSKKIALKLGHFPAGIIIYVNVFPNKPHTSSLLNPIHNWL